MLIGVISVCAEGFWISIVDIHLWLDDRKGIQSVKSTRPHLYSDHSPTSYPFSVYWKGSCFLYMLLLIWFIIWYIFFDSYDSYDSYSLNIAIIWKSSLEVTMTLNEWTRTTTTNTNFLKRSNKIYKYPLIPPNPLSRNDLFSFH